MTTQPPTPGQTFQPPPQGQPFQPPRHAHPRHGQQPQPGNPGAQDGQPAQSEGPPRNARPGRTALGWRRVDLANLTSAAMAAFRANRYVVLGDHQGRIMFSARKLEPIVDGVRRGLSEAAQQGRFVIPTDLATLLGLPVQPGARRLGKSGHLRRVFAVMGLIVVGLISGAVSVS